VSQRPHPDNAASHERLVWGPGGTGPALTLALLARVRIRPRRSRSTSRDGPGSVGDQRSEGSSTTGTATYSPLIPVERQVEYRRQGD